MRATCPKCEATYDLPSELAARLPASVRCARCGNTWEIQAETETPGAPAVVQAGAESGANTESKPDANIASKPDQAVAAAPIPSAMEMPASPKQPAGEKLAAKPAATADHPRGEGKGAVGLAPAATPLPVPEPSAAKPEGAAEPDAPDDDAPLSESAVRWQWTLSLVALAVVIGLILGLHGPIGHAWPPMQRVYHAIGLD